MNARIRQVGLALVALFVVLTGQITYLQVVEADELANHPRNVREVLRQYAEPRGLILTAEEEIIATSEAVDTDFRYRRRYPAGELFGHVSGMFSFTFGATGVESVYGDELAGSTENLRFRDLGDLLIGKEHTGTVVLTVRADAQRAARNALDGRPGAVVALDPRTGGVLAAYSEPSYDPEPLAAHDQSEVRETFEQLSGDDANPMLARAWREVYPPGSVFKIVTAATALEEGDVEVDTEFPVLRELELPQTTETLANFGDSECGGTLAESFRRSCNTTFAQVGLDLGEDLVEGMRAFGIGDSVPFDERPEPVASLVPDEGSFELNQPLFAQAGIGQGDVAVTPLQMALVAAGIANDGAIMEPHVGDEIRDVDGNVVERIEPRVWKRPVSPEVAGQVRDLMVEVVSNGTGARARIPGVDVAGKTGTAQVLDAPSHTWFVAFAPAEDPVAVVAVLVEHGGGEESTGGRVAAPVAKQVLEVLLAGEGEA